MRLKRFSSSALCLNDDKAATAAVAKRRQPPNARQPLNESPANADDDDDWRAEPTGQPQSQGKGAKGKSKVGRQKGQAAQASAHLLAPEDPIVRLARQRRPSVGAQGSLNVDQQGK